jgi:TonB family protein
MDAQTKANLLAWWLQAGVVVLVAAPLPRLLGLWSPRVRMAYWRVVLPFVQPRVERLEPPALQIVAAAHVVGVPSGSATAADSSASPPFWRSPLPFGAVEVLVAGVLLRLGWLGLGVITVGRLRRSARRLWPRPGSIDRAATLAETDAEFLVSATASRPVTCGVLWPVVLVPRTFESFPENEQMAIACHELLHVNRSDWLRNAIDEVVRAALWFHPAIWWLINQIQLAREQVVDREAVRRLGARQAYLEALLRMARPAPRLNLSPATLFLKRAHLRQRVTLIVKEVSMSKSRLAITFAVMAGVVVIGGSFATSAFPLQQAGARTPGVATPLPQLSSAGAPVSVDFQDVALRRILAALSQMGGFAITYDGVPDAMLNRVVTVHVKETRLDQVLGLVIRNFGLVFTVTSSQSLTVRPSGVAGAPGSVSASSRPGVSTGTASGVGRGTGAGVGSGASSGVAGGVAGGVPGAVSGGVSGGVEGGVVGGLPDAPPLPPPPQAPVRVGGNIRPPTRIVDVKPVYPEIAQSARVQGVVIIEATIGQDGKVTAAKVLRSIPLLDQAAIDAVLQWEFTPTLLNGNPVPVIMTTTVNFTLDGGTHDVGVPVRDTATQQAAAIAQQYAGLLVKYGQATDWPADAVRVGGGIKPPTRIVDVRAVYPEVALSARAQGVVICEVLIGPDGKVADARVLRSIPLLDQAAIDAVRQWVFTPTLLNGNPVPVIMTVTVNFTLE